MNNPVGSLKKVGIKSVWPKEEQDFTPWLKEHGLKPLLEKIGFENNFYEIKSVDRESPCGDCKKSEADLVVTYLDGEDEKTMVIENQYGKCDADHLGRLLMYAADKKASVIIWITEEEKSDYVNTVNWLNENWSSDIGLYLVRISLVTIGDSLPAPVFDILAQPTDESAKVVAEKTKSEDMDLFLNFWLSCREDKEFLGALSGVGLHQRKANGDRWKDYSIRSGAVWLCAAVTSKEGYIKASIVVKNESPVFASLMNDTTFRKLESAIGYKPIKGKSNTKVISTINFCNHGVDITQGKEQQAIARKWFGEMLPKMKAFLESEGVIGR